MYYKKSKEVPPGKVSPVIKTKLIKLSQKQKLNLNPHLLEKYVFNK